MRNTLLITLISVACNLSLGAQALKKQIHFSPSSQRNEPKTVLEKPKFLGSVYSLESTTAFSPNYQAQSSISLEKLNNKIRILEADKNGLVNRFEAKQILTTRGISKANAWKEKLLILTGIPSHSGIEFSVQSDHVDELGIQHLRYEEMFEGIKVYGADYLVHLYKDDLVLGHGLIKIPNQKITPKLTLEQALVNFEEAVEEIDQLKASAKVPSFLRTGILQNELVYWQHPETEKWYLTFHLEIRTTPVERWETFIDAENGKVLHSYKNLCKFHNHDTKATQNTSCSPQGGETTNAQDLFNINRTINVWREGSNLYLLDASRAMFNPTQSKLDDPVGAIWTIDAFNTSPSSSSFRYDQIKTSGNTWAKNGVSAHYNGGLAYLYYLNVHGRNSINGQGGSIVSLVNVAEDNGKSLDNAFWNGEAMFYGNGDQAFTSLAKALDVAGHEMSHGVIQSTANLAYEGESGAINESFADVFGAMIDRDDWKLGEDVVNRNFFPSGALRDLSDPHNGASQGSNGWQPRHVNEQYRGTQDNGGVHINSGITNYAFYIFVQEIARGSTEEAAKGIAEKVYYRALSKYLSRSSQFKDLRNAVEQSAKDLHGAGSAVFTAAQKGFDAVGIGGTTGGGGGGGGSTSYQNDLPVNPGPQYIVATDETYVGVYLVQLSNNQITQISSQSLKSKPSITDNGEEIYFINDNNELVALFLNRSTGNFEETVLDNTPTYRNAVISKDGRHLAALYNFEENKIHVYDFVKQVWKDDFILINPTYSDGITTSDVRYADYMDFDHGGEYLMYDALSRLQQSGGGSYEYWDIGFIRVFNRAQNNFGDGKIQKLFSKIPENTSIGNPVFARNSPYIITFDYVVEALAGTSYQIFGMNIETNDVQLIVDKLDDLGYPSYSVMDDAIIYDKELGAGQSDINRVTLASNKISASGSPQTFFTEARWGSWIAFGTRKLIRTDNLKSIKDLAISPNPCIDYLLLEFDSDEAQDLNLSLIDMMGKTFISEKKLVHNGKNIINIPTESLNAGVYILQLDNLKGSNSVQIVKE